MASQNQPNCPPNSQQFPNTLRVPTPAPLPPRPPWERGRPRTTKKTPERPSLCPDGRKGRTRQVAPSVDPGPIPSHDC